MSKKRIHYNSLEGFYRDIYRNALTTKYHNDTKANWIMAISAGILGILVKDIGTALSAGNYGYLIIFISAFISFILGLMIIVMPRFMKLSVHDDGDLMYFNRIRKIMTPEEYVEKLKKINTTDDVIEQYVKDLFNMYTRNISVKYKLIKIQVDILIMGIFIGGLLLFII